MMSSACAIYRLPFESEITKIIGPILEYEPHNSNGHFIIAPFEYPKKNAFMIRSDEKVEIKAKDDFPSISIGTENPKNSIENFQSIVKKAVSTINATPLEKVVLSRIREYQLMSIETAELFFDLCDKYPEAFIYLVSEKDIGTWVGASPELLLKYENGKYSTHSLAGTMKTADFTAGESWSNKELKEQAYVTDYIMQSLIDSGSHDIYKSEVFTKMNGPICHLCNNIDFNSDLPIGSIMKTLHPTPAVCGTPVEMSRNFILENETHNRDLYTGFIGPNDINNKCQFYVNLRCMRLYSQLAQLFVGAGITEESDAEKEWIETENKAQVLMSVMQKIGT